MMSAKPHFVVLDGMRGIAAVAVVAFHADAYLSWKAPKSAYLAVDFFFVLSGFVLARAYGDKVAHGLEPGAFLKLRVFRLYPLYIAGTLMMLAAVVGATLWGGWATSKWSWLQLAVALPLALAMLPSPVAVNLFPLNIPAWSMFYELIANLAFAARWLSGIRGVVITGAAAVVLVVAVVHEGTLEQGTFWYSTVPGLARVFYSFPLGVLLYRFWERKGHVTSVPSIVPMAMLLGLMFVYPSAGAERIAYDLVFALVLSPALVLLGAQATATAPGPRRACAALGFISYPIYILQAPIVTVFRNGIAPGQGPWLGLVYLAIMVLMAWILGAADGLVRRNLAQRRRCDDLLPNGCFMNPISLRRDRRQGFHHDVR